MNHTHRDFFVESLAVHRMAHITSDDLRALDRLADRIDEPDVRHRAHEHVREIAHAVHSGAPRDSDEWQFIDQGLAAFRQHADVGGDTLADEADAAVQATDRRDAIHRAVGAGHPDTDKRRIPEHPEHQSGDKQSSAERDNSIDSLRGADKHQAGLVTHHAGKQEAGIAKDDAASFGEKARPAQWPKQTESADAVIGGRDPYDQHQSREANPEIALGSPQVAGQSGDHVPGSGLIQDGQPLQAQTTSSSPSATDQVPHHVDEHPQEPPLPHAEPDHPGASMAAASPPADAAPPPVVPVLIGSSITDDHSGKQDDAPPPVVPVLVGTSTTDAVAQESSKVSYTGDDGKWFATQSTDLTIDAQGNFHGHETITTRDGERLDVDVDGKVGRDGSIQVSETQRYTQDDGRGFHLAQQSHQEYRLDPDGHGFQQQQEPHEDLPQVDHVASAPGDHHGHRDKYHITDKEDHGIPPLGHPYAV